MVIMQGEKNDWGGMQNPKYRGKLRMIYQGGRVEQAEFVHWVWWDYGID